MSSGFCFGYSKTCESRDQIIGVKILFKPELSFFIISAECVRLKPARRLTGVAVLGAYWCGRAEQSSDLPTSSNHYSQSVLGMCFQR